MRCPQCGNETIKPWIGGLVITVLVWECPECKYEWIQRDRRRERREADSEVTDGGR